MHVSKLLLLLLLLVPLSVRADEEATQASASSSPVPTSPSRSQSVGSTSRGRLEHGVAVRATPSVEVRTGSHFGTEELVELIEWAAAQVAAEHEGSVLRVGDLSARRGGRLRPHGSHRSGRDADIGFYLRSGAHPRDDAPFVSLGDDGTSHDERAGDVEFDVDRNWTLIEALLSQDAVPVQYIMVVTPLKRLLRAEGVRRGASAALLERFDAVVGPQSAGRGRRRRADSHDSHFHVRIFCPDSDRGACLDEAPFYPWVDQSGIRRAPRRSERASRAESRSARRRRTARRNRRR